MRFGDVPEGKWFRVGKFLFKRHTVMDHDYPDETAIVMEAPNQKTVGEIWTFDYRSTVHPTWWIPRTEAENPKRFLRGHTSIAVADEQLRRLGYKRVNDITWNRQFVQSFNHFATARQWIWFDSEADEWCYKGERRVGKGEFKQVAFQARKSLQELMNLIRSS